MRSSTLITIFIIAFLLQSCGTTKDMAQEDIWVPEFLDTMVINGSDPSFQEEEPEIKAEPDEPYRAAATRTWDLLHTSLDLKFDWSKEQVIGTAELQLTPIFREQRFLELDAVGFKISDVRDVRRGTLDYTYNGEQIRINLGRTFGRSEKVNLSIKYIASPSDLPEGGSAAITSDKGLFFINADGSDDAKPQQIWTQGETEHNSKWFPTIDKPNERCTQQITLTVQDRFTTLSNGLLASSTKNANGTRTDIWKMDLPHAPYLFMLAIGEYAWVEDKWNDLPLYYIVEEDYKPYAKEIYNNTPEMLTFFSDILDYPYPWSKYAQVIARDYVSGAMENTTASIFGEFVQKTGRELIDDDNDLIVAHEMFHHWFGDLVTCESWSNLTLNEGFANYSEYLWYEHKYGKERADYHRLNEMGGYFNSAYQGGMHPLIHFRYADKEDMFDAHSYNKGGLVLHMLRSYLGDDLFFASLNRYLTDNAYTAVEVDELRMAFEDTSGEDLNWFFDQWYLNEGHPTIDYTYSFDEEAHAITFDLKRGERQFRIPFEVAVYDTLGKVTFHKTWLEKGVETLTIKNIGSKPACVFLDGKEDILGQIIQSEMSVDEALYSYKFSPDFIHRYRAFGILSKDEPALTEVVSQGLDEDFYMFRLSTVNAMSNEQSSEYESKLRGMAINDAHSQVRRSAFKAIAELDPDNALDLGQSIINKEQAYPVINSVLSTIAEIDPSGSIMLADRLKDDKSSALVPGLASLYAKSKDPQYATWFEQKIEASATFSLFPIVMAYSEYLTLQKSDVVIDKLTYLKDMAINNSDRFRRYMSTYSINNLKDKLQSAVENDGNTLLRPALIEVTDAFEAIKIAEEDPELMQRYSDF